MQAYEVLVSLSYIIIMIYYLVLGLEMKKFENISKKFVIIESVIVSFIGLLMLIIGSIISNGALVISNILVVFVIYLVCLIFLIGYIWFCFYVKKTIALLDERQEENLNEQEKLQVGKVLKIEKTFSIFTFFLSIIAIVVMIVINLNK